MSESEKKNVTEDLGSSLGSSDCVVLFDVWVPGNQLRCAVERSQAIADGISSAPLIEREWSGSLPWRPDQIVQLGEAVVSERDAANPHVVTVTRWGSASEVNSVEGQGSGQQRCD